MQGTGYQWNELDGDFAAFLLKTLPLALMIVNDATKIEVINEAAQNIFNISNEEAYLQKCGDILKCINADTLEGCGECIVCRKCILRKSVLEALNGKVVSRNKGTFHVIHQGEVKVLTLLVTASPIYYEKNTMVIVIAEDVSLITQLQGMIPICSVCHRIHDEKGEWMALEKYLMNHSEAELTHDICPVCSEKMRLKQDLSK
ncbi:PAS domain-containing protein [Pelosinus baikalensis]|uniref:PAS domain-containing protein n=1 Tax=Pelosinus baikalensis TaxID=2892015 RepID=A0ABS8HL71_9FIRM|nr:PAS domain-containing protein [Pelosinus baikalensis]MCC5463918.1 PAS domain-containing protein [Pelosinus baikalensis]